jgi:hypothetical protein|nr:PorT family protein [Saprospiraceae bacterium]
MNCLRLFGFLLLGFFLTTEMQAQTLQNYNFNQFQNRPYYFGISLGYNSSNFKISHSTDFIKNDSYRLTEAINGPGFEIGVIGNLKFGDYFDFRMVPTFVFTERTIQYTAVNSDDTHTERLESVFVEIPFLLRFKSHPYKDKRFYVIAGVKYNYDLQNNSRTRQAENIIQISPHDYQAVAGFGMQIFLPYFILSPQITFSHGLSNSLIINKSLEEASVLEKILSRTISFSILFEG